MLIPRDDEILINLKTLEILEGKMLRRAVALVLEWASHHRDALIEDWNLCQIGQTPRKIAPLK